MMFLMRLAFWLLVIVLLLPATHDDNQRLISSAEKTVSDLGSFCDRNPDVCESAQLAATSLWQRVQNSMHIIETWLGEPKNETPQKANDRLSSGGTSRPGASPKSAPLLVPKPRWQDTLTDADKSFKWRGPDET